MITQAELKRLLHYDKDTGVFTWNPRERGHFKCNQSFLMWNKRFALKIAGCQHHDGYIRININGKLYSSQRLAWLYIYEKWPTKELDHIDQIKTNNCIKNLREVTRSQNAQNRGKQINNTSGFIGVSFAKREKKWVANIKVQNKRIGLGYFETAEIASEAYKQAQEKYHSHRPQI